jgi:hypothetical protein
MSVESFFSDSDRAEFKAATQQVLRDNFMKASNEELTKIAGYIERLRAEVGPEKKFPAAQLAEEIYSESSNVAFESAREEGIFWAEKAELLHAAWGEKFSPVAVLVRSHELFDTSNPRSQLVTMLKLYTGVRTAAFSAQQAYANWDQVLNDDDLPKGLQAIELSFTEMHLLILEGYITDDSNFVQTQEMPIEIPLSRIERIFYLDPNHPGDGV